MLESIEKLLILQDGDRPLLPRNAELADIEPKRRRGLARALGAPHGPLPPASAARRWTGCGRAMNREEVASLTLYPEERTWRRPTTDHVLLLFRHVARHVVERPDGAVETFEPELTEIQLQVLRLLGVPPNAYDASR